MLACRPLKLPAASRNCKLTAVHAVQVVLLRALTQHLIYLKSIDETRLQQCLRAVEGISAQYAQLWPKQRPRVHQPLSAFLIAASLQSGCLQIVLPRLVSTLLQHTLKPEEIADQQAGW